MSSPKTISYDVHPSVKATVEWVKNLKVKTGRSLDKWNEHINASGPKTESARREWLKKKYGMGTNTADWLAQRSVGKGYEAETPRGYLKIAPAYVASQYAGKRAHLLPIFEELARIGKSVASDATICPCQTIVPIFRHHVIAQIKATTIERIDMGFALGDRKATGRLIDTGGFSKKDRITHRIGIRTLEDIDAEVHKWLKIAYERDGGKK